MTVARIAVVVTTMLSARGDAAPRRSDLSPEAAAHNDRGVVLLTAGDPAAALPELLAAYAAMPDAVRWRAGRGKVLGSLRSVLNQLYATTRDPAHLCRLQRLLREHIEALLLALGDDAGPEAVTGSLARLREVNAELGDHRCEAPPVVRRPDPVRMATAPSVRGPDGAAPAVPAARPVVVERPVAVVPARVAPVVDSGRPLRLASGALFGVGFVGLSGMALGAGFYTDSRSHLRAITADVMRSGQAPSSSEKHDAAEYLHQGQRMRALAIAGGVIGGVAVIAGAILRARGVRRSQLAGIGAAGALFRYTF